MASEYDGMKASRDQRIDQMERVVDLEEQLEHANRRFEEASMHRDECRAALREAREKLHALLGVNEVGPTPSADVPMNRPMYDR